MEKSKDNLPVLFAKKFGCGLVAAAGVRTLIAPFVITHLHSMGIADGRPPPSTYIQLWKRVVQDEGFFRLYRGNWLNIKSTSPLRALRLSLCDFLLRRHTNPPNPAYSTVSREPKILTIPTNPTNPTSPTNPAFPTYPTNATYPENPTNANNGSFARVPFKTGATCGAIAGAAFVFYTAPFAQLNDEIRKARYEDRKGLQPPLTKSAALKKLVKRDGYIRGPFKFLGSTLLGQSIYNACYFGIYYYFHPQNFFLGVGAAWLGHSVGGYVMYPIETVQRRLRMSSTPKEQSFRETAKDIAVKEGWKSFFKGSFTVVTRGLTLALILPVYDRLTQWIE